MTLIEAAKQALEALEQWTTPHWAGTGVDKANAAHAALRTAIAEAESVEPVAKVVLTETLGLPCLQWLDLDRQFDFKGGEYLYTTPPAQPAKQKPVAWLGLEPSDMPEGENPMYDHDFFLKGMAWADAILRKKNTTPPAAQRQWVGLTDDEQLKLAKDSEGKTRHWLVWEVEAKLKEKNNG